MPQLTPGTAKQMLKKKKKKGDRLEKELVKSTNFQKNVFKFSCQFIPCLGLETASHLESEALLKTISQHTSLE